MGARTIFLQAVAQRLAPELFAASQQVIQMVIVGVSSMSVSTGRLPSGREGHSGDDSVASGMRYGLEHIEVRVCKGPV